MRKLFTFVTVVACAFAIAGCKEKVPSPTEAFKAWLHAIEVCDVEAIKAGLTDETVTQFTQMGEQMKKFTQNENAKPEDLDIFKQMCKAFQKTAEVKDFTEEITGDEARVKFVTNGKENSAPMLRTEKGWKLDLARMMREAFEAQMEKMKIQAADVAPAPEAAPAPEGSPAPADKVDLPPPAGQPVQVQPGAQVPPPAPNSAAAAVAPTRFNPGIAQPATQVQLNVPQKVNVPMTAPVRAPGTAPTPGTTTTQTTTTQTTTTTTSAPVQAPAQIPAQAPTGN